MVACSRARFVLFSGARQAESAPELREAPDAVRPVHREAFRGVRHLQRFRLPQQKQRLFAGALHVCRCLFAVAVLVPTEVQIMLQMALRTYRKTIEMINTGTSVTRTEPL